MTLSICTYQGLGSIPSGAVLDHHGMHLEMRGTHIICRNFVHPLTVSLTYESKNQIEESGHDGAWRVVRGEGVQVVIEPFDDTGLDALRVLSRSLHNAFEMPYGIKLQKPIVDPMTEVAKDSLEKATQIVKNYESAPQTDDIETALKFLHEFIDYTKKHMHDGDAFFDGIATATSYIDMAIQFLNRNG